MDDAVADGDDVLRVEGEGLAEAGGGFAHHLEQVGQLEALVFERLPLRADHDRDLRVLLVGVVDDAVDVGAAFLGVVDAEVDLADADVEGDDLARLAGGQRQQVTGFGLRLALAVGEFAGADRARPFGEQPRQVGDRLRIDQDVRGEDFLRHHQHEAAIAGDYVGGDAIASEQREHAEDVARAELGDDGAGCRCCRRWKSRRDR